MDDRYSFLCFIPCYSFLSKYILRARFIMTIKIRAKVQKSQMKVVMRMDMIMLLTTALSVPLLYCISIIISYELDRA